jgi:myo-inositol-hexaphosphate 3-phosphohydrolase
MTKTEALTMITIAVMIAATAWGAAHERDTFIKQYDSNQDGKVTHEEFVTARTVRFNTTDTDHNGTVDEGEYLVEYIAQLDDELVKSQKTESEKTRARQRQLKQTIVRFHVLDADHGKSISKEEYDASGTRSFNNHDTDKDSMVTAKDEPADRERRAAQ